MTTRTRGWAGAAAALFVVAWGAQQFASLLVAYHQQRGLSPAVNDALFGIYAIPLMVALFLCGPAGDRWGRVRVARPAVVVAVLATVALMVGSESTALLFVGRFLAGASSGAMFAVGTVWVRELSHRAAPGLSEHAGPRRATIALSLGFGLGPLVSGIIAQWSPLPLVVAYVPHLVIFLLAVPLVWRTPETAPLTADGPGYLARLRIHGVGNPRFLTVVAPPAPWVFANPSVSVAVLPTLVIAHTDGLGVFFSGVTAGVTLAAGVLIQPLARRLDTLNGPAATAASLTMTTVGMAISAVSAALLNPWLVLVAAVLLGTGYGLGLVGGLLETHRLAGPGQAAGLTAVFYMFAYAGFFVPLILAELNHFVSYTVLLGALAVLAALTIPVTWLGGLRAERTGPAVAELADHEPASPLRQAAPAGEAVPRHRS
jgi:Major Facilitator Superfamily